MSRTLSALLILALLCGPVAALSADETPSPSPLPKPAPPSAESDVQAPLEPVKTSPESPPPEERYYFERGDRRDPFRPSMAALLDDTQRISVEGLRFYTPQEEDKNLHTARALSAQISQFASQDQHAKVVELYDQLSQISPTRFANEAYRGEVKKIHERLLPFFRKSQLFLLTRQGEVLLARMSSYLESDDYDKVLEYAQQLEDLVVGSEPPDPVTKALLAELIVKAYEIRDRAQARKEFAEMEINISAIAWSPESPAALINNVTVRPGDLIADQLKVFNIEERSVIFLYKGEEITRNLETIRH